MEEREQKDIAVQQALSQARSDKQSQAAAPSESVAVVTDGKHTYNVTWLTSAEPTQNNIQGAFLGAVDIVDCEDKDKE